MYAHPADVVINIGRPLTESETARVDQWIDWAEATISRGPAGRGEPKRLADLDPDTLHMVVVEAVTRRLHNPNGDTQVTVSVDDGSMNRTLSRSTGLIEILPEQWAALGWSLTPTGRQAFTIRPHYEPDRRW